MAGPAIRAWQIAKALGKEHEVVLASTVECRDLSHPDFVCRFASDEDLHHLVAWCDVIVFQGLDMWTHPVLKDNDKIVVTDIYDPFHLEQLEATRELADDVGRVHARSTLAALNQQLHRGDLFLCASDKQRDFWLGQLSGLGRINPATYRSDERLDNLVQVVPFGVSDHPPQHTRDVLKGVIPGIGADDKVILWGGGVYNWFDPLTLIRAVDKLRARMPNVRLFFLGMGHPNPNVPAQRVAAETEALSADLGLTGTHVFFNEGWVEYEDRQNYLLEADIGVSTHLDHIETEFSFRTRILDYLWASLPVVATAGDSFGDLIERDGFGLTVPPGDSDALEAALFTLLDDTERYAQSAERAAEVAQRFLWSNALEPLVQFCRRPQRAADLADPAYADALPQLVGPPRPGFRRDLGTIVAYVRDGDFRTMASKAKGRLRRAAAAR
jgi:glycosyltransferase involved in cell wall biosynthesis